MLVDLAPDCRLSRHSKTEQAAEAELEKLAAIPKFVEVMAKRLGLMFPDIRESEQHFIAKAAMYLKPADSALRAHLAKLLKEGNPALRLHALRALKDISIEHRLRPLPAEVDAMVATLGFPVFVRGIAGIPDWNSPEQSLAGVKVEILETLRLYDAYNRRESPLFKKDFAVSPVDRMRLQKALQSLLNPSAEGLVTTEMALRLLAEKTPQQTRPEPSPELTKKLVQLTRHERPAIREAAAEVLGTMHPNSPSAIRALSQLVSRAESAGEVAAAQAALSKLTKSGPWYERFFFWR
jgi:hypothetical protein